MPIRFVRNTTYASTDFAFVAFTSGLKKEALKNLSAMLSCILSVTKGRQKLLFLRKFKKL